MSTPYAQSPLCARNDGAMLAFLLFMSRFTFARERYPVLRMRMEHLLNGIDADVELPDTQDQFVEGFLPLFEQLVNALGESGCRCSGPSFSVTASSRSGWTCRLRPTSQC
jgi:hypothetical protein